MNVIIPLSHGTSIYYYTLHGRHIYAFGINAVLSFSKKNIFYHPGCFAVISKKIKRKVSICTVAIQFTLLGKKKSGKIFVRKNLVTSEKQSLFPDQFFKFVTFPRPIFKIKRTFMSGTAFFQTKVVLLVSDFSN